MHLQITMDSFSGKVLSLLGTEHLPSVVLAGYIALKFRGLYKEYEKKRLLSDTATMTGLQYEGHIERQIGLYEKSVDKRLSRQQIF